MRKLYNVVTISEFQYKGASYTGCCQSQGPGQSPDKVLIFHQLEMTAAAAESRPLFIRLTLPDGLEDWAEYFAMELDKNVFF